MKIQWLISLILPVGLLLGTIQPSTAQGPGLTPTPGAPTPTLESHPPDTDNQNRQADPGQPISAMGETLTVPFRNGTTGMQTSGSYGGPVTVRITGVGQASGTAWSDAFYIYTNLSGQPITPVHPTSFYNWTLWINGRQADYFVEEIPPYNPDHDYTITFDAPGGLLSFAVGDAMYWDNAGEYTVHIWEGARTVGDITHMEVTQVIQDEGNNVPLIDGKPTFVRVYVHCDAGCTGLTDVDGLLRGYGPAGELPGPPVSANERVRAYSRDWRSERGDLDLTLNFTLPPAWTSGTVTLEAEAAGDIHRETFSFQPARTLRIAYVPIHYDPSGCAWTSKDPSHRIAAGHQWAQKVYPTAKIEYSSWPKITWPLPLRDQACRGNTQEAVQKLLITTLDLEWFLTTTPNGPRYVFGWLPNGAAVGGASLPPGSMSVSAYGDDDPMYGERTLAHELAHLLGRPHTKVGISHSCGNPTPGLWSDWPYSTAKIQEWGVYGYGFGWLISLPSAVIDPIQTYDYMSYCWFRPNEQGPPAWTSPYTYQRLYSQKLQAQAVALGTQSLLSSQPHFIASGLVYTNNTAFLNPIWVITPTGALEYSLTGADYCLDAQDSSGVSLASHCFDLPFVSHETGGATNVDGFTFMLPYPGDTARIVLRKGNQELAVQSVSVHSPEVHVVSPNGGEMWNATGAHTITWTASDVDGDPLTYSVLYSPGGTEWMPVATAITTTQVAVDVTELAGGSEARVRVLVTDGVNTSSDESDAPFSVGSKGPEAFILSPEGDGRIQPGTPLFLQGYAFDLEDGTLGENALRWTSSQDGDLEAGSQALVFLSEGHHVITFSATDSDDNLATDSLNIFVGNATYLPIILK